MRFSKILILLLLSFIVKAEDYIPKQAFQYLPIINQEILELFPEGNYELAKAYFPSLIEHESCITLTHSKCWNPKSTLKTKRELGIGFGQTTKAFNNDGSIRFDSLSGIKRQYPNLFNDITWDNLADRPDAQIKILILLYKDNYKYLYMLKEDIIRMQMADAAYNGGLKGVKKDREVCGLKPNCNPNLWFGNVEFTCSKSKKILYGNRSACDINRYHVYDVFKNNLPKYQKLN